MDIFDKMDSLSEVSSTTTNSRTQMNRWYSEENRKLIARKLDLSSGTRELHMDQVQVDRRRLEGLLFPDREDRDENRETAELFFNKIMMDTNTYITWPTRLKAGTKTKKNPFVNIAGRYSNVAIAKAKVLKYLENKSKKIVMKIDVSYTDHSHIIGRGGSSIQKVMDETKCHIHFPDSNRTNPMEKNNQVSVHGDVENVERARAAIRNLSSLIFSFELPTTLNQLESRDILIDQVSSDYNVRVSFRKHSVLSDSMIIVKGSEYEMERVRKATLLLSEQLFLGRKGPISFCTSMEISIQHHSKVLGEKSANLLKIMKYTNTEIIFADSDDPNVPVLRKSNVVIKGALNDIYLARQLLTGLLPVSIAFDVTSDRLATLSNSAMMLKLMEVHDVKITARQKFGQTNGEYAIVKGYERNVGAIYKVRNILLGLDNDNVVVGIPRTYIPPKKLLCGRFHDTTSTVTTPNCTTPCKASSPLGRSVTKPYARPANNPQTGKILYQSDTLPRNNKSPQWVNNHIAEPKLPTDSNASSFYQLFANGSSTNTTSEWDYERTRMAAVRAIKNSDWNLNPNRVPTSMWSGFGVSNTSPAAMQTNDNRSIFYNDCTIEALKNFDRDRDRDRNRDRDNEYDRFSVSSINCSNIIDDTSNMTVRRVMDTSWNDIADLLVSLNLEKYIAIFETNDIDLALFCTLKESDLVDLGVVSFGARRKLLLAISEINKRKNNFSLAPGAERFRN